MTEQEKKAAAEPPLDCRVGRGLELLREAVRARRECHKAYSELSLEFDRLKRMPTRDEYAKEVALRSALGMAERAVMDAAELLTPNA